MGAFYWIFVCYIIMVNYFQGMDQLTITKVNIPESVRVGEEFVILDCEYDFENTSTTGLVIKWFLNVPGREGDLVYQWIKNREPQAIEPVERYIDLSYKASEDPNSMYRAMKLVKPDTDLGGNYTCQISTFEEEVEEKRPMTVYATGPEDEFKLYHTKTELDGGDGLEVTCQANGLFPKPTLDISIEGLPNLQPQRPVYTEEKDRTYNVKAYMTLLEQDLSDSSVINCKLGIPSVNYTATKKLVYLRSRLTTAKPITLGGTTKLLRKMEIQAALDNSQADEGSGGGRSAGPLETSSLVILTSIAAFLSLYY